MALKNNQTNVTLNAMFLIPNWKSSKFQNLGQKHVMLLKMDHTGERDPGGMHILRPLMGHFFSQKIPKHGSHFLQTYP